MYCTGVLHICSILSRRGEARKEILRIITCPFNLNWHIDTEESTRQRFATCCRLSCVCFIICPGGGNRIYYYPAQRLAHWHNSPLNIEPRSRRCNYIGYNEASARVSGDTRGWWLSPMQWPSVLTSPPWSLIRAEPDTKQLGLIRKLHYTPIRSEGPRNYQSVHITHVIHKADSIFIIHFFLCCRIILDQKTELTYITVRVLSFLWDTRIDIIKYSEWRILFGRK